MTATARLLPHRADYAELPSSWRRDALARQRRVFESLRHENHLIDSLDDAIDHARTHVAHGPH
jgi:hypothetical protein